MAGFELSELAARDLSDIYIYSFQEFGEMQADAYLLALESCFMRLAEAPERGRQVDHIRAGYFRFTQASHVVFYMRLDNLIRVVRVLHGRMDVDRHL